MSKRRVLVVDDEEIHRMWIRDRLEAEGYEVRSAEDGNQALEMIQSDTFDLIILDLLMPTPNGFGVFQRLKEQSYSSRIPILILTVVGLEPQVQRLLDDGAHHLQKSEGTTKLGATVRGLLPE